MHIFSTFLSITIIYRYISLSPLNHQLRLQQIIFALALNWIPLSVILGILPGIPTSFVRFWKACAGETKASEISMKRVPTTCVSRPALWKIMLIKNLWKYSMFKRGQQKKKRIPGTHYRYFMAYFKAPVQGLKISLGIPTFLSVPSCCSFIA